MWPHHRVVRGEPICGRRIHVLLERQWAEQVNQRCEILLAPEIMNQGKACLEAQQPVL
jgi:hypothetical protein